MQREPEQNWYSSNTGICYRSQILLFSVQGTEAWDCWIARTQIMEQHVYLYDLYDLSRDLRSWVIALCHVAVSVVTIINSSMLLDVHLGQCNMQQCNMQYDILPNQCVLYIIGQRACTIQSKCKPVSRHYKCRRNA